MSAARRIGAVPRWILFVEDAHANVGAAAEAGLAAVRWTVGDGHEALVEALAQHGGDRRLTTPGQ